MDPSRVSRNREASKSLPWLLAARRNIPQRGPNQRKWFKLFMVVMHLDGLQMTLTWTQGGSLGTERPPRASLGSLLLEGTTLKEAQIDEDGSNFLWWLCTWMAFK
jgi:hypothetical protein